jgi:hypothetical protein
MDRLTEELRAGLNREASGIPALGDMDRAIEQVGLTRRRWAGGVSLVVVLLVVGAMLALWRPSAVEPATPVPGPSVAAAGPSRLLPPMCGHPELATARAAPYDDPRSCPDVLPIGTNYGYVSGGHMVRDVVVDIPGSGWVANDLTESTEVFSPAGNGVTVIAYPKLAAFPKPDSPAGSLMLGRIRDLPEVKVLDSGTTTRAGFSFTWMDLTVATEATLSEDCRLEAPCLPLITNHLLSSPAVELRPGRVSRLLVEDGTTNVPVAIWIHDTAGPDAAATIGVADSLTLNAAHE